MPTTASTPMACNWSISSWLRIPPAAISLRLVVGAQPLDDVHGDSLHQPFGVDVGVEKASAIRFGFAHHLLGSEVDIFFPAVNADLASARIHGNDQPRRRRRTRELLRRFQVHRAVLQQRGAHDHLLGSGAKHAVHGLDRADSAADLARQPLAELPDERFIRALAHGRVEVDQLHHRDRK